jgi:cytochrome P450
MSQELYDPFNKEWLKNKFTYYDKIRDLEKAYWSETYKMYVFTRYEDVAFILSKPDIFISGKGNLIKDQPYRFGMTPGASDGKTHSFYRSVVKDAYSKSRIEAVNDSIREKTIELLSEYKKDQVFDIAYDIRYIASYMTAEVLNLPKISKEYITELIFDIQLNSDRTVLYNSNNESYDEFRSILDNILKNKTEPEGDGIYQEFLQKAKDKTPVSLFSGPAISGCYSMISAMQFLVLNLYHERVLQDVLNDRSLESAAIDEELRFNATTGKFKRTVAQPITIRGIDLQVDDQVAVCLDGAMRDPIVFENPNEFNLYRNVAKSRPFGAGPHACAGQAIARAGLGAFLTPFLDIIGNYEVITKELDYIITASGNNDVVDKILIRRINS